MTRLRHLLLCAAAGAALILPIRPITATTVVALDDADLARGARTIVHGDVVSRECFVTADTGRIYTEYRFAPRELLKGSTERDGTVLFREWGGEVGGIRYWIPGLSGYRVGEEVVAFLGDEDPNTGVGFTYGLAQGKFIVKRDHATGRATVRRDLGGLRMVGPGAPAHEPDAAAGEEGEGVELEAFKARIRGEVRR